MRVLCLPDVDLVSPGVPCSSFNPPDEGAPAKTTPRRMPPSIIYSPLLGNPNFFRFVALATLLYSRTLSTVMASGIGETLVRTQDSFYNSVDIKKERKSHEPALPKHK